MIAWPVAFPLEPSLTGFGFAAASAVRPARYWPGAVPAGTLTVNSSLSPVPGLRVTVAGRPVTQQPPPAQRRTAWLRALPPLAAVIPVDRLMISLSVVCPGSLMRALAVAE